jgi:hypothetical protein
MDAKSVLIGVLALATAVLGYLYYDCQQTKVKIDLPGVRIEGRG